MSDHTSLFTSDLMVVEEVVRTIKKLQPELVVVVRRRPRLFTYQIYIQGLLNDEAKVELEAIYMRYYGGTVV